jgi:hypothetical protein
MKYDNEKMLELCYSHVKVILETEEDLKWFKELPEEEIVGLHHSIGTRIRNDLKLWNESVIAMWFKSLGLHHADDMSTIILNSFHRKLNNKPILLDEQVEYYLNWWAKPENERYR